MTIAAYYRRRRWERWCEVQEPKKTNPTFPFHQRIIKTKSRPV